MNGVESNSLSAHASSADVALAMVRHGQSAWNKRNLFTGWEDPALTPAGRAEARKTAQKLMAAGCSFDAAFTSYLRRAVETLWIIQKEMNLMWLPTDADWRLNERHYGALQGKNKDDAAQKFGAEQVRQWRREYDSCPPPVKGKPQKDHRYQNVDIPRGESLADAKMRASACYEERIVPLLQAGRRVLIVAHGNVLRSLMVHLQEADRTSIAKIEIPTGGALVYSADEKGKICLPRREL